MRYSSAMTMTEQFSLTIVNVGMVFMSTLDAMERIISIGDENGEE